MFNVGDKVSYKGSVYVFDTQDVAEDGCVHGVIVGIESDPVYKLDPLYLVEYAAEHGDRRQLYFFATELALVGKKG